MIQLASNKQKPCLIWITGLSASGKTTMATQLNHKFIGLGYSSLVLDGDNLRAGLNVDLGFSELDRKENLRRAAHVANLLLELGYIVVAAFISPKQSDREMVKKIIEGFRFIEIYLDVSIEICKSRDPKGLYQKAANGVISNFTGVSQAFEKPTSADLTFFDSFHIESAINSAVSLYLKE